MAAKLPSDAAALAKLTPDEIDENLQAWLPPPVAFSIATEWGSREIGGGQREAIVTKWFLGRGELDRSDLEAALAALEAIDRPAPKEARAKALTRLRYTTKWRDLEDVDLEMQMAVFHDELAAYPADAILDACRAWAAAETFFPAWAELRALCEERVFKRRSLADSVRRRLAQLDKAAEAEDQGDQAEDRSTDAYRFWRGQRRALEDCFGGTFGVWIEDLVPVAYDGQSLTLGAVNEFTRAHLNGEHRDQDPAHSYRRQLAESLGLEVEIVVLDPRNQPR